jgi:acyl-homoserine lactone acylase PvdQ
MPNKCQMLLAALLILSVFSLPHGSLASDEPNGKITIYRDEYGVPHIYAPTHEAGLYAQGWASAEDRLGEILTTWFMEMCFESGAMIYRGRSAAAL